MIDRNRSKVKERTVSLLDQLRRRALEMPEGAKFPTVRTLMAELNETQYGVQSAIKELNTEGILKSQVGNGTRVVHPPKNAETQASTHGNARVLLLHHVEKSERSEIVAARIHEDLTERGFRVVTVSYSNEDDVSSLLGSSYFEVCVLQPRYSTLTVRLLELASRCSRNLIVEGRILQGLNIDIVSSNHADSMRLALKHLGELGHKKFGLISENRHPDQAKNDFEQLYDFIVDATHPEKPHFSRRANCGGEGKSSLTQCLHDWKEQAAPRRPSAVIVWGRFSADQVLSACKAESVGIPEDLSIVRICSTSVDALHGGIFTTVGCSAESIANAVSETVQWRACNPTLPTRIVHATPQVMARSSTAHPSR